MRWGTWVQSGLVLSVVFGWSLEGRAFEFVFPDQGAELEVGKSYVIQVKPGHGEEKGWTLFADPEEKFEFNSATGMYEWVLQVPKTAKPGPETFGIVAIQHGNGEEIEIERQFTIVLPPPHDSGEGNQGR